MRSVDEYCAQTSELVSWLGPLEMSGKEQVVIRVDENRSPTRPKRRSTSR